MKSISVSLASAGRRDWRHHTKDAESAVGRFRPTGRPVAECLRLAYEPTCGGIPPICSRDNLPKIRWPHRANWIKKPSNHILWISNDILLRSPIVPNDSGIELTQLGRVPSQKYDANQSIFWDILRQKLRAAKSWNILTDLHFLNELFVGRRSKFQLLLFPSP